MDRRAPVIFRPGTAPSALAALAASEGAGLVVDVAAASIVAATEAAVTALGLPGRPEGAPPRLDAATPALAALAAAVAASERDDDGREAPVRTLVFWTLNGIARVSARVMILRDRGEALAIVSGIAPPKADITRTLPPAAQAPPRRALLAHELKTPLNVISAIAEVLEEERFGPLGQARYKAYATDIRAAAKHMADLIVRMLERGDTDRDPAHAPDPDAAAIDVGSLLAALASQLRPLADAAGITLDLDVAPSLPHLIADATSLRQIVLNLISNALRFTPRGGRITISAVAAADGTLALGVSDTGTGMSAGALDRITRPHAMADDTDARSGGLGLPLVRALAAANGGALTVENAPGGGTVAVVIFAANRLV